MTKFISIIILLSLIIPIEASASNSPIVVGVLEKPQCKEQSATIIRALFVKNNKDWIALDSERVFQEHITKSMTWVIAFDGRNAGTVKTIDPGFDTKYPWTFSRDRVLNLAHNQKNPHYPNKTQKFSGWCWAPSIRPVIVSLKAELLIQKNGNQ